MVLGAMGSYGFACRAALEPVSIIIMTILGLSVWIIYLTDHLLDSFIQPPRLKYGLFNRHRHVFKLMIGLLIVLDLYLILKYLPNRFIFYGSVLGFLLGIYLLSQHFLKGSFRKFFPKEIYISIIYTLAIWGYPLMASGNVSLQSAFFMFNHFMLVLTNVLIFSFFDKEEDIRASRLSMFTLLSEQYAKKIIKIICLIVFCGSVVWAISNNIALTLPAIISVVYFLEVTFHSTMLVRHHYPQITDGIFLLFLIYLL